MRIDEKAYNAMPAHLQALFTIEPNPARDEVLAAFPMQTSGSRAAGVRKGVGYGSSAKGDGGPCIAGSSGSAARFFYCAKASKRDRDEGLEGMREVRASEITGRAEGSAGLVMEGGKANPYAGTSGEPRKNNHPTVKPTDLMRYLCRLVTPPGGTILDPFTGSGSTGKGAVLEGFNFVGIEREAEYVEIARARIAHAELLARLPPSAAPGKTESAEGQQGLFTGEA